MEPWTWLRVLWEGAGVLGRGSLGQQLPCCSVLSSTFQRPAECYPHKDMVIWAGCLPEEEQEVGGCRYCMKGGESFPTSLGCPYLQGVNGRALPS